jgi:hypothetical protein
MLMKQRERILGLSQVHDYVHCPDALAKINLYNWIQFYKQEKLPKKKKQTSDEVLLPVDQGEIANASHNISLSKLLVQDLDIGSKYGDNDRKKKLRCSDKLMHF